MLDLAVSVASGTPWLGIFPCPKVGPVLLFLGEGGERKMLRRLRAVASARGLTVEELPIRLCCRVPHLTDAEHLLAVEAELVMNPPRLVILDPLYLAARGARGSDLYEMGSHLERLQHVAQSAGAALVVVHHWNKTGEGKGAKRMSGVGPGAWGRVLVSVAVENRRTDEVTGETAVTLSFEFTGDEIPDTDLRVRRRVWADDPNDLASALHYEVTRLARGDQPVEGELAHLRPSARRILDVLRARPKEWMTTRDIGDDLVKDETGLGGLKVRTIQDGCQKLVEGDHVDVCEGRFSNEWRARTGGQDGAHAQGDPEEDENAF
jgi:hypothetical protein